MTLVRVHVVMDKKNKIAIPLGIGKELNVKPGEKLELKVTGIKKARKLIVSKPETGRRLP